MPYAVVGSVAFFGRMEVKDLLAYLRIIFNPEDDVALLRIINTPPRGIGSSSIDLLTEAALAQNAPILQTAREKAADPQLPGRIANKLQQFITRIDKWSGLRDSIPMAKLIETILEDIHYKEMLQKNEAAAEAENRLDNLGELIRAAAESEERGESITDFLDRASLSSELDHLDPNAHIALMTLHSAKGLEFDVVFLAGMEEGLFPHSQSMNSKEDIEEERRLCYVGITRARRKLFVTWTPYRKNYGPDAGFAAQVSRFLKEMPESLIEGLDSQAFDYSDQQPRYRNRLYEETEQYGSAARRRIERSSSRIDTEIKPKSIAELKAYLEQQKRSSATASQSSKSESGFKAGMRVRHDQFGDGIILSRERVGNDFKLVVTFSRVGKKALIEKYAKLKSI
jgi:DNA helicase II / ATP-dependent DNA helicase PcrA